MNAQLFRQHTDRLVDGLEILQSLRSSHEIKARFFILTFRFDDLHQPDHPRAETVGTAASGIVKAIDLHHSNISLHFGWTSQGHRLGLFLLDNVGLNFTVFENDLIGQGFHFSKLSGIKDRLRQVNRGGAVPADMRREGFQIE